MKTEFYTTKARTAWNEAAPVHWEKTQTLIDAFREPSTTFITPFHLEELSRIGLKGSKIAHLNCNNGRELISLIRSGAEDGVGFDISSGFIEQANLLRDSAGVNCQFYETDIYDMPDEFADQFDIVLVTAGALCFMPDLPRYFSIARKLLKPGGYLNIYDCHPIVDMFEMDRDREGRELRFIRSYFDDKPIAHTSGLDYVGGTTYQAQEIFYFHHKLSDIVMAALGAKFTLERLEETGEDPSQAFPSIEASAVKPPLSFLLTGRTG